MFRKTLFAVVLTLLCAAYGFAQQIEAPKGKVEKSCEPPQISAELTAEAKKKQVLQSDEKSSLQNALLKNLLPASAAAWVVEIVTTGGFGGNARRKLTITSSGDLFVSADNISYSAQNRSTEAKKLKTEILQKISEIIFALKEPEKLEKTAANNESAEIETAFLCNDCYQTSIIVGRRDADGEVRFFTNREKNILFSNEDFKQIHRIISLDALNLN